MTSSYFKYGVVQGNVRGEGEWEGEWKGGVERGSGWVYPTLKLSCDSRRPHQHVSKQYGKCTMEKAAENFKT